MMGVVIMIVLSLSFWTWFSLLGRRSPATEARPDQPDDHDECLWTAIDDLQLTRLLKDAAA